MNVDFDVYSVLEVMQVGKLIEFHWNFTKGWL